MSVFKTTTKKLATRIALVSALALGGFMALPGMTSTAQAACVINVPAGDVLNMRSRPTSRSSIVRGIPRRACNVRLRGRYSGNWGRVTYRGQTGWVNMRFIDEGGDGDNSPPVSARYCVNAPGDFLNFRFGPGTGYDIVGSANHGWCGMTRIARSGRWWKMRTHEFDGWVNSRYVRRR